MCGWTLCMLLSRWLSRGSCANLGAVTGCAEAEQVCGPSLGAMVDLAHCN